VPSLSGRAVGLLKIGLEAFVRWGPPAVEEARASGAGVFLDLKLHDIPATVAGAVRSAAALGRPPISRCTPAAATRCCAPRPRSRALRSMLAVTLLTHLDARELTLLGLSGSGEDRVARWALLAAAAGCAGVVCSPLEVRRLRVEKPAAVRAGDAGNPFRRRARRRPEAHATAAEALAAGADFLVIGRPLTRAADPGAALAALEREIAAPPA
jgi:orotidine-5'-phosphate decarboxylase